MGAVQMQMVARGVLAYEITGSAQITGIVSVGFAPSMFLFALFGGALVERMEKRTVIQACQFLSALNAFAIGGLFFIGSLHWSHMFISSMVQGALFAFQMPARQAIMPLLVKPQHLSNAVSLNAMAMSIMSVVSPGIAGVIYGSLGADIVYFCMTGLYIASMGFTATVPKMKPSNNSSNNKSVVRNIYIGLLYIRSNRLLRLLIVYSMLAALLSIPFRMLIQVFAKNVYNADPSQVGWLLLFAGLGGLGGSFIVASLRSGQRRGLILICSAFISALSLVIISGVPIYWVGLAAMVGLGLGEAGRWALGQSLIMEFSDQDYRARVMSVFMMTFSIISIGIYPLSVAMEVFGSRAATAGLGFLLFTMALSFFLLSKLRKIS